MQDQYSFLNGVLTEFKDGGLQLREDPNPPATESVLILGTAIDGPVMEPVAVDARSVYELFGKATSNGVPNGSTLVQAFEEAYRAGSRDIRLMRISGAKATGELALPVVTRTYEAVENEFLGLRGGNEALTITAQHSPFVGAVTVFADGVQVPPSSYTVTAATGTILLKANTVNAGASISIRYTYDNSGTPATVDENTDGVDPYVATGLEQTFTLGYAPDSATLHVYIDGAEVTGATNYTLTGKMLAIKPVAGRLGARIEASYSRTVTEVHTPKVNMESVFGGSVYNQTLRSVEDVTNTNGDVVGKKLVIRKPASKQTQIGEAALEYTSIQYPTLAQLAAAVNADARNNVVRLFIAPEDETASTSDLIRTLPTSLTGGADGLAMNKTEKFAQLQKAYGLLENYLVDAIVVVGATADELVPGQTHDMPFAYQLALAAAVISHRGHRVTGFIQTSSPADPGLAAVEAHVQALEGLSMSFNMRDRFGNEIADGEGNKIDLGGYLVVFAGPDMIVNTSSRGTYAVNSAAALAGFVSTLAPEQAPTNKVVTGALGVRYTYGMAQANRLVQKRFTVLKAKRVADNPNAISVVVEDAPTASAPTSDWARLSTVRAVKACVDDVKDAADPFIGQPNTLDKRNAFAAAMAKKLDARKAVGTISNYQFRLVFTQADLIMGALKVELDIVPPFELRKITQVVGLTPGL